MSQFLLGLQGLGGRHGSFFENIFFEKLEKSLPFFEKFEKNSKKIYFTEK
jgi:hypothetical protein